MPERFAGRVLDLDAAVAWRESLRAAGRTLVTTNGVFDLVHAGHVAYLAWSRAQGDALLVLMNEDASVRALKGPERPIVAFDDRARVVAALRSVDAVVGFAERTPETALDRLRPDVHVKSAQYRIEDLPERVVVEQRGGRIVLAPHNAGRSTTDLVAAIPPLMRIAITANGPGEFAGWVRPLVAALRARDPSVELHVLSVPDDFATGREAAYLRDIFPGVHAYAPAAYVRLALGRPVDGLPARVDRVQYLGGDLSHAARVHARLGGVATSYKFSRKKYKDTFARVFAVDAANAAQLEGWGVPPGRITVVGNLAIDGALGEAAGTFGEPPSDAARDGIVLFPGSRKHEVVNGFPMFARIALNLRRMLPDVPIAFAGSPFVPDDAVRAALVRGGEIAVAYGATAALEDGAIVAEGHRFPLLRSAMGAAASARLAIAIPGTKVIELAALGVPTLVCVPFNAPELVVIGGPLQYVGKLPLIGKPLKRAAVLAFAARFEHFAQPNIDAGRAIDPEIAGTLLPSQVAHTAAARWTDAAWCRSAGEELRTLYAGQAGAAGRMADALLEPVPA